MSTPTSLHARPQKRMRLGTKSCAECRRRKVRCVFATGSSVCQGCKLHSSDCIPQQAGLPSTGPLQEGEKTVHRLEELEGMVKRICGALGLDIERSTLADFEQNTTAALQRLHVPSYPDPVRGDHASSVSDRSSSMNFSSVDSAEATPESLDHFDDAPLLCLFKKAMIIQSDRNDEAQDMSPDPRFQSYLETLNALLPDDSDLTNVLTITEAYWDVWPVPPTKLWAPDPQQPAINLAKNFLHTSLSSGNPAVVAKAAVWFAYCVQQLPLTFVHHGTSFMASPSELVNAYARGAEAFLSLDEETGGTLDALECSKLLCKLYLNAGMPRKGWLCNRHGLNLAMLMGLHRPENLVDERRRDLWGNFWQNDRFLSMTLGLPYGIAESHPGLAREHAGSSVPAQVVYDMSIIAGHVVDRDQNQRALNYATTIQIDQELEQLKTSDTVGWLHSRPAPNTPVGLLFQQQFLKMIYYQTCKNLHLPYLLKASSDRKFETSRIAGLDAARGVVRSYLDLRENKGSSLVICDFMDFQAFGAAAILTISLLSKPMPDYEAVNDWELVNSIIQALRCVYEGMECTVALQAVQLLEYLQMASSGTYTGPEIYEAVIPYFGKVRIRSAPSGPESSSTSPSEFHLSTPGGPSTAVEFDLNSFLPNFPPESLSDAELGMDWTAPLDLETTFDWNQLLSFPGRDETGACVV